MNKLLVVLSLIFSVTLLVAGCSNGDSQAAGGTYLADSEDAGKSDTPQDIPDATVDANAEIVAGETKNAADVHDETLAAVADGTYVENVNYMSPGGMDTIEVSITVENDIVTDASITAVVADPKSESFISKVNAALPELVIGKKITEIDIPVQVSGSSLTSKAFRDQLKAVIAENPA